MSARLIKKLFLTVLGVVQPLIQLAQLNLQGKIYDQQTSAPVSFCAVGILHKSSGVMANEDGIFIIRVQATDTLILQHPGYKRQLISARQLQVHAEIHLQASYKQLQEVVVNANNEWLYALVAKAEKKLAVSSVKDSKAYFSLLTKIDGQSVELLECYYTALQNAAKVKQLHFKNGRAGAAQYKGRYFMNLNSSQVFSSIDLLNGHRDLPAGPLQMNKKKLYKNYTLSLADVSSDSLPVYHLLFSPRVAGDEYYSGELWIEKETHCIKKIKMLTGRTSKHPFLPLFPNGKVRSVAMQITKVFSENNVPEHLDFTYTIHYQHTSILHTANDTFDVDCKGLLYFYDYDRPFIPPRIQYDESLDDYQKITLLSYNDSFWELIDGTPYSKSMLEALQYFTKKGELINFENKGSTLSPERQKLFENNFIAWSGKKRISLKNARNTADSSKQIGLAPEKHNIERYNLKAQLFMDLNETADSLQHCTLSLLDTYKTFYNLAEEPETNCFFNIYFDLFEIHRRVLDKKLATPGLTAAQAIRLYEETVKEAEADSEKYIREVERGKRKEPMEKWNQYVIDHLGIDNLQLYQIRPEQLQKGPEPLIFERR